MDDEDSLSHQLAIKLLLEELEIDDALKEQRRQRASREVVVDRVAPEGSIALPSGASTHTDRRRDLYQDTLGPSFVDHSSQETSDENEPVVGAAGDAREPSPAPVTEDDGHEEDDDDLYRDDGVTINLQPRPSPAPVVAPTPAPVTEDDDGLCHDDGMSINQKPEPSPAPAAALSPSPGPDNDENLSRDVTVTSQKPGTRKVSSRGKKPLTTPDLAEVRRIAAEARRRDPLSNLPVETNDRRRTVCGLAQAVGTPARRSQPVAIHEDKEDDLISFEDTVTFRPQSESSSLQSMPSDSHPSGTSSLHAQEPHSTRPLSSRPNNSGGSVSSRILSSQTSRPGPSRPETTTIPSRPSGYPRPGPSSRFPQSSRLNGPWRSAVTTTRPETTSLHSRSSRLESCTPPRYQFSSPIRSETTDSPGSEPSCSLSTETTSLRSQTSSLRPEASSVPRRPTPFGSLHSQPLSPRFESSANPRPEDNVLPRGASPETDPDKENVYCHNCGKDGEESFVWCACGHYYCHQCLGQIVESSLGGDSSSFPPLCCDKLVPVDLNSTILDKDVLKAFMEKKLGLPLSERANRVARTKPFAAKVGQ
ncbi:hypothetical protein CEP54_011360 [Fusarium duplospermum]|uniref:RING-type domain-containing protein n=1 Tax=Fusarium duplospermum TaxID=1325734 RepID=A0A428PEW8_9HYPO|nr:hypothetical protein CEP54_011360 [Fusarium duplospermum]